MRNLAEYPVTSEEVVHHLAQVRDQIAAEAAIGGLHSCILTALLWELKSDPQLIKRVVERLKV